MASLDDVQEILRILREYYGDRDGSPRVMNDVQIAMYLDGLVEFDSAELMAASRQWMATNKWWPMLSDLRDLLLPKSDTKALAHLAWTTFERAISRAGIYRGATFEDPAIGECVRQVFGTWDHACSYETDSPGWAMRKQTFIELFPMMLAQAKTPVTLRGLSPIDPPLVMRHVEGFPAPEALELPSGNDGKDALAEVTRRFKMLRGGK